MAQTGSLTWKALQPFFCLHGAAECLVGPCLASDSARTLEGRSARRIDFSGLKGLLPSATAFRSLLINTGQISMFPIALIKFTPSCPYITPTAGFYLPLPYSLCSSVISVTAG